MKYVKFEISKFKWINREIIDLSKIPQGKIFPLVWLNESGKTTILEAIHLFQEQVDDNKKNTYIHKDDLSSFSWEIYCKATLELDEDDGKMIENFCKDKKLVFQNLINRITIERALKYENSQYKSKTDYWKLPLMVKTRRETNYKKLYDKSKDLWNELIEKFKNKLPKILYFSDFLFDFPEKIYLENIETLSISDHDKTIQNQYKAVVNDILNTSNPVLSINDFLDKIKRGDPAAEAIKQRIAIQLKEKIIQPWSEVFPGQRKDVNIKVESDNYGYFIILNISIWGSTFSISEMSLWFRRFFSFILFTEFRKSRNAEAWEYLFLFDEPASNLHEHSQQKLLNIFDKLVANDRAKIIYSTHSPYLINPKYILTSFIIKDEWRNSENEFHYRQNIKAYPYRSFVGNHDEEFSHFKPILDALDFTTNPFELTHNIVFTEWKHDYYTFKRLKDWFFDNESFNFYPWWWVTSYEKVFREYIANNKKFVAIFDWDREWKSAKKGYLEDISEELVSHIFSLDNIDTNFDNKTTEFLFTDEDKLKLQKISYPDDTRYHKGHFNKSIENIFINNIDCELSEETLDNVKKVFDFIKLKLED